MGFDREVEGEQGELHSDESHPGVDLRRATTRPVRPGRVDPGQHGVGIDSEPLRPPPAVGQQRIIGLLGQSLPCQVARLLLDEAVQDEVLLQQRTVAAMIGVQRPSLNKVLKDFERRGLLTVGYGSIAVRDPRGLERIAE